MSIHIPAAVAVPCDQKKAQRDRRVEARTGIDDHGQAGACAIVRAAFLRPQPWVNGGGLTRVIVDRPDTLRLSLATISEAGPFRAFPASRVSSHWSLAASI
jgi:hypothetical protein